MIPIARLQQEQVDTFRRLHHTSKTLLLPNIWDPIGALLLADLGYPAVATSSAAIAWSQGYPDGEKIPFDDLLHILKRITACIRIPVTADIERAYASNDNSLREHIRKLIDTGIAGINYEDSLHNQVGLLDIHRQCQEIEIIRETATACGSNLFINARTDVYIKAKELSSEAQLAEAILRGKAYREAGADGLYPIILNDLNHIHALVQEVGLPLNVTLLPDGPNQTLLGQSGVARLSLATGFIKAALGSMKQLAHDLRSNPEMNFSTQNLTTYDYLASLVAK